MIHTSLSPNTEPDDLWLAFKSLILPWNWFSWKKGKDIDQLEEVFRNKLQVKHAVSFERGRDALYVLLQALGIGEGDEVILQAYTCIVVPNAIQYTGAKPVYVDIEEQGFNIDPQLIAKSITPRTKALIVQHTFGEPADIEVIREICQRHKIVLIEDCAHALSARYKGKLLGTFGHAAIWSFGRDKIISSVWGGMVTTDNEKLVEKIRSMHDELPLPSLFQIKQALLHPLFFSFIKPFYVLKFTRGLLALLQKIQFIPRVIFPAEKRGKKPQFMPQKIANILARLALHQLKKLDRFHQHRLKIAQLYSKALKDTSNFELPTSNSDSAWLRYTIRTPRAHQLFLKAQRQGIYLGDWYTTVLAPPCNLENFQYREGFCPRAEKAAQETLNLPTHVQMDEGKVREVVEAISSTSL